jgi:hypothetical protein
MVGVFSFKNFWENLLFILYEIYPYRTSVEFFERTMV